MSLFSKIKGWFKPYKPVFYTSSHIENIFSNQTLPYPDGNPKTAIGATKPDLSLIPPTAELHLATAMMDGGAKYGPYNWRDQPVSAMTYIAAARRHLAAFLDGENFDPISKVHHLGHMMACGAILLDAYETGSLIDNRPLSGPSGALIRGFNAETKLQ